MGSSKKADLLILDGRHLLYRTSDAFRDLHIITPRGANVPTGGMYGFLNISIKIHQTYGGTTVVAWEGDKRNFRLNLMPSYKRRDEPLDDEKKEFISEMSIQEKYVKRFLQHMGVRQYLGVNCEADDVIGNLAFRVSKNGKRVYIYSGDSDLRQLVVSPHGTFGGIWAVSPGLRRTGDKVYGPDEVREKHGVGPSRLSDLKALAGDNSDNVPGVVGIGPKTAAILINHYGDLENVIRAASMGADDWPVSKRHTEAINCTIDLPMYHELTRIKINCDMEAIKPEKRQAKVVKMLHQFKFRSLASPAELQQLMRLGG